MTSVQLRKETAKHLSRILFHDAYLNIVSSEISSASHYSAYEKTYLQNTIKEVVTWYKKYQWLISRKSKIPLKKIERSVLIYLLIGVQNLIDDPHIPDYTAIHEVVEAVKKKHGKRASGYVNGVLRALQRENGNYEYPDSENDPVGFLATVYSHPEWMIEKWVDRYGYENTEKLCKWNNQSVKETTIRLNLAKNDIERFVTFCEENGNLVRKFEDFPRFMQVRTASELISSSWFAMGYFTMQSVSSGLAPIALAPEKGSNVADLCAAPGGKSTFISELMENSGVVVATDSHKNRLTLVRENAEKLGCSNIRVVCADAGSVQLNNIHSVLIDVPCSGLGTIHRKSDIKWKRTPEQITELTKIQSGIINNAARLVKKGGVILYSTCTIEPEENEGIINRFLSENRAFVPEPLPELPGLSLDEGSHCVTILPFEHNLDGSFIAKLRRIM